MKKQSKRKTASKRSKAAQPRQRFGVTSHSHTGKLVSRRHTSYPALAMIVLCAGVFLASWTNLVAAVSPYDPGAISNNYDVHAKVPGIAPTDPATIDSPTANQIFTQVPITVSGTCPLNTYVQVFRNAFPSGTTICDAQGKYELAIDLFSGANVLTAQDYNFGDLPGPVSSSVKVTYKPPVAASTSTSSGASKSSAASNSVPPLLLKTDYTYQGAYVGDWARWQVEISGGTAPYALAIDWGDGQHDLYSRTKEGVVAIEHKYDKAGGYKGSYAIKISASDSESRQSFLQVLAIVNDGPSSSAASTKGESSGGIASGISNLSSGSLGRLLKYVWPSYGVAVLMLASFWLGERHELKILHLPGNKRKAA